MLLIKKHKGGSDFDVCLSFNVLVAGGFTKKPGNVDSYFPRAAGTQTSNFPSQQYTLTTRQGPSCWRSYCVLRARLLGCDLPIEASIRAGRRELPGP